MKTSNLFFIAASLFFTVITSCKKDHDNSPQTWYGIPIPLGADSIRSFVTLNENGEPESLGLQFGENALNDLPTDTMPGMPNYMYHIALPQKGKFTGIDHIEADWSPFGHEPHGVYDVPHFDFHFYYITPEEQAAVIPGPDTVKVAPQFVPKDYFVPVPYAIPFMGTHWFDTTATEFHGAPFTSTFIYGFYHGNMTFLEPMITRAFFLQHPDASFVIKKPQAFQKSNYHPANYQVQYDATKHVYRLTLSGFVKP